MSNNFGFFPETGIFFVLFSLFINIFFWLLIIWVIVVLIRAIFDNTNKDEDYAEDKVPKKNKYVDIIKTRYADGGISRREYEQLMDDLG